MDINCGTFLGFISLYYGVDNFYYFIIILMCAMIIVGIKLDNFFLFVEDTARAYLGESSGQKLKYLLH